MPNHRIYSSNYSRIACLHLNDETSKNLFPISAYKVTQLSPSPFVVESRNSSKSNIQIRAFFFVFILDSRIRRLLIWRRMRRELGKRAEQI